MAASVRFCPEHWEALRQAIDSRGMSSLVAGSGEQAVSNMASELDHGSTVDNFDPLMGAHNAIVAQAMDLIRDRYQQNPLMLMVEPGPFTTWPTCPICALNWCHKQHIEQCTKEDCDYPRGFDWTSEMIDGAAGLMLQEWEKLRA